MNTRIGDGVGVGVGVGDGCVGLFAGGAGAGDGDDPQPATSSVTITHSNSRTDRVYAVFAVHLDSTLILSLSKDERSPFDRLRASVERHPPWQASSCSAI
jgi:hypothetical protein